MKPPLKDGSEKLMMAMIGIVLLSPFVEFPGLAIIFTQDWEMCKFIVWISNALSINTYIMAAVFTAFATTLWTQTVTIFSGAMITQGSVNAWLLYRNKA